MAILHRRCRRLEDVSLPARAAHPPERAAASHARLHACRSAGGIVLAGRHAECRCVRKSPKRATRLRAGGSGVSEDPVLPCRGLRTAAGPDTCPMHAGATLHLMVLQDRLRVPVVAGMGGGSWMADTARAGAAQRWRGPAQAGSSEFGERGGDWHILSLHLSATCQDALSLVARGR